MITIGLGFAVSCATILVVFETVDWTGDEPGASLCGLLRGRTRGIISEAKPLRSSPLLGGRQTSGLDTKSLLPSPSVANGKQSPSVSTI